jgi:hypothetical protein
MAMNGDLHTIILEDVLEWIARREKTGILYLYRRSTQKQLAFRSGRLYSSWSNDPRENLGQILIRFGFISEQDLFTALLKQEKEGRLLGAILVADGVLTEEQLKRALNTKAEDVIYDLFLWPDGRFEFKEGVPKDAMVGVDMDTRLVVQEGMHRLREWQRVRLRLPTSEVSFLVPAGGVAIDDPHEKRILALAAAGKTLGAIALEIRHSEFETALLIEGLIDRGALVPSEVRPDEGLDPVGAIAALLKVAEQWTKDRRYDAAIEAYEQVLALDGINQTAKKGVISVGEARKQEQVARLVPLDKVPVLKIGSVALTKEKFDSQEGFVLSRINGQWNVQSILKLCPMPELDTLNIFARLLDRGVIELQ